MEILNKQNIDLTQSSSGGGGGITLQDIEPYIDGQWVLKDFKLAELVEIPTTEDAIYDLSDYLPNDDCNYEIELWGQVNPTRTTTASYVSLFIHSSIIRYIGICSSRQPNVTSYSFSASSTVIIPVGVDRVLKVAKRATDSGTFTLYCRGYRRLGKVIS